MSADFDPTSRPEIEPFFRAHLTHLFRKKVKVVIVTLWDTAPPLIAPIIEEMAKKNGQQYGTDYAFLGFKPGKELAIKGLGENIYQTFPSDPRGNRVGDLPIMQGKKQAKDFDLISSVSAGFPGTKEYVLQIQAQYDLPMISACTAVSGPDYIPYYKAHMLKGLSAGMPGSAQYEKLVFPDGPPEGHAPARDAGDQRAQPRAPVHHRADRDRERRLLPDPEAATLTIRTRRRSRAGTPAANRG